MMKQVGASYLFIIINLFRSKNKKVIEFTDDNFDTEVLKSEVPVLVDFWANGVVHVK